MFPFVRFSLFDHKEIGLILHASKVQKNSKEMLVSQATILLTVNKVEKKKKQLCMKVLCINQQKESLSTSSCTTGSQTGLQQWLGNIERTSSHERQKS